MKKSELILLTGGIGAGKSVVARVLRLKGFMVYDTDASAKRIMNTDAVLKDKIIVRWGEEAYTADGVLNRPFVASKIFGASEDRLWLNHLVHIRVIDDMMSESQKNGGTMFVECALPVTSGIYRFMDYIWLIEANEELRIRRASTRDESHEDAIKARIAAQSIEFESLPPEQTFIITNDGEEELLPRIDALLKLCTTKD